MTLREDQKAILVNIIYAVETGGHVYGSCEYDNVIPAGYNSPEEKAITIGAGQFYAAEARELLNRIKKADRTTFLQKDNGVGLNKDLRNADWSEYDLREENPEDKTKIILIKELISSEIGIKCQNEMIMEEMQRYMDEAERIGVKTVAAQMMCANWRHQGGPAALTRLLTKCFELYKAPTLDNLYETCKGDTGNQVGAYKERQLFVYTELKNRIGVEDEYIYAPEVEPEPEPKEEELPELPPVVGPANVILAQKKFNHFFDFNIREDGIWDDYCRVSYVKALQYVLKTVYNENVVIDGYYNTLTNRAVGYHILRGGEKNLYVRLVQIGLYAHDISLEGMMDGEFGPSTRRGVIAFQKLNGLDSDGAVGKETMTALCCR